MAVPVGERDEGKFSLAISAESLAAYTIHITANEKVFTPEYRRAVTDDIVECAKNIYIYIMDANDVKVRMGTPFQRRDYMERAALQKAALRNARRLLRLIDIAHRVFHLSSKRVKYWGGHVISIRNRIQGWIDDDEGRYLVK